MKAKTILPLVIGLGVGFFAIKLGIDMVKRAKGSPTELSGVFVSAKTIEVSSEIKPNMLVVKEVPTNLVPSDSFVNKEKLIGRITKMPIAAGVPITKGMLSPPGSIPGLSSQIPPGHRAVSVKVNEESAVAGFITPGSRVDVSSVFGGQNAKSRLILSDVQVGAVGQSLSQTGPDGKTVKMAKSVTLFLRPADVQTLNAAIGSGRGRLRLALRGHTQDPGDSLLNRFLSKAKDIEQPAKSKDPDPTPVAVQVEPVASFHMVELRSGQEEWRLVFDEQGGVRRLSSDDPLPQELSSNDFRAPPAGGGDGL